MSLAFAGGEQGGDRQGGVGQGAGEPQQQLRRADQGARGHCGW